jgi:hypothetical protein
MPKLEREHAPHARRLSSHALGRGDRVPHFVVRGIDGTRFEYRRIWQRYHVILVILPQTGADEYRRWVDRYATVIRALDARIVLTADAIPGLPHPGAVVADRWGEVVFAAQATSAGDLPDPAELVEWLQFVAAQCPECEGEAR